MIRREMGGLTWWKVWTGRPNSRQGGCEDENLTKFSTFLICFPALAIVLSLKKLGPSMMNKNISICRGDLSKTLLNKANEMENVNIEYGCKFVDVDMDER